MLTTIILLSSLALVPRLDCEGTVLNSNGRPVGGATVRVDAAWVRTGTSPYCPSCYADCRKQVRTDAEGRFVIPALDPELRFLILVVAESYAPKLIDNVYPEEGPLRVVLSPVPAERLAPAHTLRGRVVGPEGKPVAGATVEPLGKPVHSVLAPAGSIDPFVEGVPGPAAGVVPCREDEVDPLAVTNAQGEFLLTAQTPDLTLWVTVRARGLAPCHYRSLRAGSYIQEIRLSQGCRVKGRLVQEDRPVEGATIGVVQTDRRHGFFFGAYTTALRPDGRFEIANLPPNTDYYVYGKMESLQGRGALAVRQFRTGDDGSAVDVGDVTLARGHELAGRVVLSDGKPIPARTRLLISREDAWDALICELDQDGRFHAGHVPTGPCVLAVQVKGYRVSARNRDFAVRGSFMLPATIDRDMKGVAVLLEPDSKDDSRPQEKAKKEVPARAQKKARWDDFKWWSPAQ